MIEFRFGVWLVVWLSVARLITGQLAGIELLTAFMLAVLCAAWLTPSVIREWRAEAPERRFNRAYKRGQRRRGDGEL